MSPRPGTMLRPTGRGVAVLGLCTVMWLLGDLARVTPARQLAAALLLMLVLGAIGIMVSSVGLRARRYLVDDAVPVGSTARVMLELTGPAWITVVPLGRGIVREHLPEPLGGQGDLPLAARMPHVLHVGRRGGHGLGPYSLIVRDLLGLFHLRRTVADDLRLIGLPVIGAIEPAAERATGISRQSARRAAGSPGIGEIGPLARPYASGDDIRRINWRASARTGQLMTREEEPASAQSAVIVLDTSRRENPSAEVEDALVSHAATVLEALGLHGWEVRVVDASGDEITRTGRRRGLAGASPLGREADTVEQRASLLALADVDFDDDAPGGIGQDHAAGHTALAIALGPDDGDPFSGLELDRFAGRAAHRTAIALRPALEDPRAAPDTRAPHRARRGGPARRIGPADGEDFGHAHEQHARRLAAVRDRHAPTRSRLGTWDLVRGTAADTLTDLLTAPEESPR
ncbi:DUF58 domain-containing protein [Brachybacterium vulturis]|uniref:DUF58 domain-containing protein n=1 Tax=Brachybacterium vulturis TaxID=2017484 RepID=UPI0037362BE8